MKSKPIQLNEQKPAPVEGKKPVKNRVTPLLCGRPVRLKKIDDCRKLLARLILEFQRGNVQNRDMKDLCYALITYANIAGQVDFQAQLDELRKRVEKNEQENS